jgi:spermidine/putrescine-binding protein
MKRISKLMAVMIGAATLTFPGISSASDEDQLKSDLVGQSMGGREKCWKFQSTDQIKEIKINKKTEDSQKRLYVVALTLQSDKGSGPYAADAQIEYVKDAAGWKIKQVGLLSMRKMIPMPSSIKK